MNNVTPPKIPVPKRITFKDLRRGAAFYFPEDEFRSGTLKILGQSRDTDFFILWIEDGTTRAADGYDSDRPVILVDLDIQAKLL